MKKIAIGMMALVTAVAVFAEPKTLYVDQVTGDDDAAKIDPTFKTPYRHIQVAINRASNGDTILVGDGEYGAEEGVVTNTTGHSRICVDRTLTLKSLHGAAKTSIVGAFDDTANHLGPDAVRCISAKASSGGTTVIDGFTFKNGASSAVNDATGRSGGVYGYGATVYVVGCIVTNCCSYDYACYNVNLIGCRVEDCVAYKDAVALQGNAGNNITAFTLFARNRGENGSPGVQIVRGSNLNLVNCTFVGCDASADVYASNTYPKMCLYNCLFSASSSASTSTPSGHEANISVADCLTDDQGGHPLYAPFFGDYRVRPDGPAANAAKAEHLDKITLPEGYVLADILDPYGNPIDTANLHLGAVQELSQTPASGALQVSAKTKVGTVVTPVSSYFFSSDYPVQYVAEAQLEDGETLFGFQTSAIGKWRFPRPGSSSVLLMPSPNVEEVVTNTVILAQAFRWVDKAEGNDETGDGSEESPFASIQKAVDKLPNAYTVMYVKKGAYDNNELGYLVNNSGVEQTSYSKGRVRIWSKKVRVIAVDGPDVTSIVGEKGAENGGCCLLMQGESGSCVQGFTLAGGQPTISKSVALGSGGGYCCINVNVHITDCVISNNSGVCASAGYGAFVSRSVIRDNTIVAHKDVTTPTVVAGSGVLFSCLIFDNPCEYASGGVIGKSTLVNCTVAGNTATDRLIRNDSDVVSIATVYCGSCCAQPNPTQQECVFWDFGTIDSGITGYTLTDPYFVSRPGHDYRVLACSPVCTCAAVPAADNFGADYYKYVSLGFEDAVIRCTDKKPMVGALMDRVPGAVIAADKGGVIAEGVDLGVNAFDEGRTFSVSATGIAERPCAGLVVNSVTNFFDDLPNATLTIAATSDMLRGGVEVLTLYTSDWYVNADATVGDDSHSGFTPKTAKRTLEKAMEGPVAGDTVHAAAGTYASGDMSSGDYNARVVVPAGVRLVGAGSDRTAIVGAPASEPVQDGCGPDALRCVFLGGANASVEGFTLRDGYTALEGTGKSDWKLHECNCGGAVAALKANTDTVTVRECVLTNCTAARGGGSHRVRLVNCRVVGNTALDGAGGSYYGYAYGTVFGPNTGSSYVVMYPDVLENCTVYGCEQKLAVYVTSTNYRFENCLFACATSQTKETATKASHCVFATDCGNVLSNENADATCVFVDRSAIALDDSGRPVVRSGNPAIDAADETLYDAELCGDLDASGFQRVMNAKMDIGALEADWRDTYAQAIGNRRVTVTAASPNVTLNDAEKVELADGDSLSVAWNHKAAGNRTVTATIVGEGMLTVSNGAETVATFTGPVTDGTAVYAGEAGLENLSFAFSGVGTSTFSLSEDRQGLMLIFR